MSLQAGLRCKIGKTKEFPAKSSRIRSYGPFRPLSAERRREEVGTERCLKEDFWDHCATKWGNYLQGLAARADGASRHGIRGIPGPQLRGTGGTRKVCSSWSPWSPNARDLGYPNIFGWSDMG